MLFLRALVLLAMATPLLATDKSAPPVPAPAFLDVVTFDFTAEGEVHKVIVTTGPLLARVDESTEGYSIIFDPQAETYIGLEHRNYTWWDFSWPDVRNAVEGSKRHEARLQELGNEGLNPPDNDTPSMPTLLPTAPGAAVGPAATSSNDPAGISDDSGYVWHVTTDQKKIGGYNCIRWTGDTVSGENVEAWCYAGPLPKVQTAIDRLRAMTEPMALVPVRNIAPDFIFPVYAALEKGGVTPLLINWGEGSEKNHFRLVEARTRNGDTSVFVVPKLYVKTTLITMDGLIKEQPAPAPRNDKPAKTWQTP